MGYGGRAVRAEILTIGDELCRGEIVNTNASWLAAALWDADIAVRWMTSCGDDEADMRAALATAAGRADLVITSGGLGPTEDDLTVDVLAAMVGAEVVFDGPAEAAMTARFGARAPGVPMPELMRRQVRVPAGAQVHGNPGGLAPCFEVALGGTPVIALPGVPREIHGIFAATLGARVRALRLAHGTAPAIARRIYRVFGRGESQISGMCRGVIDGVPGATIHYQVKFPETLVKIVVRAASGAQAEADATLAGLDRELRARLGEFCYGAGAATLPARTAAGLAAAGLTVAVAESCTGGGLGALLTDAPGASRFFRGGAIAYANDEKVRQLGVAPATLAQHGAVSEEVAREMALGARARFDVDRAVAITGVAGPDGGTADKPVGLVWLALATRGADEVRTHQLRWPGERDMIRTLAAWWATRLLADSLPAGLPADARPEERP